VLQTSSSPAYAPLKDKKHFSVQEAVARPIQYKKVMPQPSRDSEPSSTVHGPSYTVSPFEKGYAERGKGVSRKAVSSV